MKKTDVYEIAIKLFGVYLIIPTIQSLHQITLNIIFHSRVRFMQEQSHTILIGGFIVFILLALICALLIFRTRQVVKLITIDADKTENIRLFASKKSIYQVALFLTGGLLVAWSIPDLSVGIYSYLDYLRHNMPQPPYQITSIGLHAAKIIFGVFIILSTDLLSSYFSRKDQSEIDHDNLPAKFSESSDP